MFYVKVDKKGEDSTFIAKPEDDIMDKNARKLRKREHNWILKE